MASLPLSEMNNFIMNTANTHTHPDTYMIACAQRNNETQNTERQHINYKALTFYTTWSRK